MCCERCMALPCHAPWLRWLLVALSICRPRRCNSNSNITWCRMEWVANRSQGHRSNRWNDNSSLHFFDNPFHSIFIFVFAFSPLEVGCERLSPPTLYGLVIIIHFIWRLYRDQDLAIKQAGVSRPWFACVFLSLIICYVSLLIFVVFVLGDCNIWERDWFFPPPQPASRAAAL